MPLVNVDIGNILAGIGSTAKDIRTAITGEIPAEKKAELEATILQIETQVLLAQSKINEVEAASPSFFKSAWRPACAWVCVIAFALQYLIQPILTWILPHATFPAINTGEMMPLLFGLLGLGTMRSFDKIKGVTK